MWFFCEHPVSVSKESNVSTPAPVVKYAISYKLNGERRFEFALLQSPSADEAMAALQKMHGDSTDVISDVKVSKAL
nr:hypothetical protein [Pseudomonas sp. CFBP 8772]